MSELSCVEKQNYDWCGYENSPRACPFCKGTNLFPNYSGSAVTVECLDCGAVGPYAIEPDGTDKDPYQVSIDLWNGK